MSTTILASSKAQLDGLQAPSTRSQPTAPAYSLKQNDLQDIIEYGNSSFGQISTFSRVDCPRGAHLCYITTHSIAPRKTWFTIQISRSQHAEFNSALVYLNHSCAPTAEIEIFSPTNKGEEFAKGIMGEVRVARDRDLKAGEELTWFYPSTEWICASPFQCLCKADDRGCVGWLKGAKHLSDERLDMYFINKHVLELAAESGPFKDE